MPVLCRKGAISDSFSRIAKATAVTTVFPGTALLRFLLSPKIQITSENKPYSPPKLRDCCLNLLLSPCGRSSPGGVWSWECSLTSGRCAGTRPLALTAFRWMYMWMICSCGVCSALGTLCIAVCALVGSCVNQQRGVCSSLPYEPACVARYVYGEVRWGVVGLML